MPLGPNALLAPVTAAVVLAGVWVTGGLITNDFQLSAVYTTMWLGAAGLAALVIARRRPALRFPVLGAYVVTAFCAAAFLGFTTFRDKTVDENVARASASGNSRLAGARFESLAHTTQGRADVVGLPGGKRKLTLTGFATDAGPDLRVYLAGPRADEGETGDYIDLGSLKGNRGNQQYDLPADADLERYPTVLVWCRAFSVGFARARLDPARARALP